jgi:hypothetical protein
MAALAAEYSAAKLVKLALIFSFHGLIDHAAEVLVAFRDRLNGIVDVAQALDLLAQRGVPIGEPASYERYMALFSNDSPVFYPQPPEQSALPGRKPSPMAKLRSFWKQNPG